MMIGPAPMMRMLSMSVRLGIVRLHQRHEAVEEVSDVMWSRRRFRVPLKAERRFVDTREALQRAVETTLVRGAQVGGQRLLVHREAVVLACDAYPAAVEVLHGVVGTVMAEFHLEGL